MKIIPATESHLDTLVKLFEAYRKFYRKEADPDGAKLFLSNRLSLNDSTIYLAVDDENTLMGFTQLYPSFSSTRLKRVWILNDLFVDKAHRGKGVSKALISRAKEHVIETKSYGFMLETERDNVIANQLYISQGLELETNNFYNWTA